MGTIYVAYCNECKQVLHIIRRSTHVIDVVPCENEECASNKKEGK